MGIVKRIGRLAIVREEFKRRTRGGFAHLAHRGSRRNNGKAALKKAANYTVKLPG